MEGLGRGLESVAELKNIYSFMFENMPFKLCRLSKIACECYVTTISNRVPLYSL